MSALTASNPQGNPVAYPAFLVGPLATGVTVYQWSHVMRTSGGYLTPCADTSGARYAGISRVEAVNAGADGAVSIEYDAPPRFIILKAASPDATWLGRRVFFSDDQTAVLAASSTNKVCAGECVQVDASGASGSIVIDTWARFTPASAA